ncbi:hypothetical protein COLO4_08100 [Corchorus olitorius]|uniref:Uncharacterized protein n=1 Tax=Corchorus olitorius TaxID=93759 RepID=A0A1R3KHC9_9ROSI|nr:hypothetical protein COLO4_08100 [Corchorus olitorius]
MKNKAQFFEFQRQEKGSIMGGSRAKDSLLQGEGRGNFWERVRRERVQERVQRKKRSKSESEEVRIV